MAAQIGNQEIVTLLLAHGADPVHKTKVKMSIKMYYSKGKCMTKSVYSHMSKATKTNIWGQIETIVIILKGTNGQTKWE